MCDDDIKKIIDIKTKTSCQIIFLYSQVAPPEQYGDI